MRQLVNEPIQGCKNEWKKSKSNQQPISWNPLNTNKSKWINWFEMQSNHSKLSHRKLFSSICNQNVSCIQTDRENGIPSSGWQEGVRVWEEEDRWDRSLDHVGHLVQSVLLTLLDSALTSHLILMNALQVTFVADHDTGSDTSLGSIHDDNQYHR